MKRIVMGLGPSYNMLRDSYTCLQEETLFFNLCSLLIFISAFLFS